MSEPLNAKEAKQMELAGAAAYALFHLDPETLAPFADGRLEFWDRADFAALLAARKAIWGDAASTDPTASFVGEEKTVFRLAGAVALALVCLREAEKTLGQSAARIAIEALFEDLRMPFPNLPTTWIKGLEEKP